MGIDPRLLLLADGRFPTGGHAHSAGIEAAAAEGAVRDVADLEAFLLGWLGCGIEAEARLAALAADVASTPGVADLARLDAEAEAAQPSPALRSAGRRLGRSLLRSATEVWPADARLLAYAEAVHGGRAAAQHPVAFGAAAAACLAGADDGAGARRMCAAAFIYASVSGAAWTAVRLLPMDAVAIAALLARLSPAIGAATEAALGPEPLPAGFAPAHERRAEAHAQWEVRLFAS